MGRPMATTHVAIKKTTYSFHAMTTVLPQHAYTHQHGMFHVPESPKIGTEGRATKNMHKMNAAATVLTKTTMSNMSCSVK